MMPTLTAAPDPQIVYLSNAGDDESVVLNGLRARGKDSAGPLAYLEWSAAPERNLDDREGWAEANPALGTTITAARRCAQLPRAPWRLATFETEHLCRWVVTTRERLVDEYAWKLCAAEAPLEHAAAPVHGDQHGARRRRAPRPPSRGSRPTTRWASGSCSMSPGTRSTPTRWARISARRPLRLGVAVVGFDPLTDAELAKFFRKSEPISGGKYANATTRFVTVVKAARRLRWDDAARSPTT